MTLAPGTRLGPYEILSPIGVGGMGEVYRARDARLDRTVAVKVLPANVAGDAEALSRFEREAKAVAALSHPNIMAIHDFGREQGVSYAVMEFLEGETLRQKLVRGGLPRREAVNWAVQIARGLSAAHEKGIVHRDIKPENLFVTSDGQVKILDFGLAKRLPAISAGQESSAPTVTGRTEPGTVMGTLSYMSPEQVRGLPADQRSDIFSFGAVLYEMLSGKKAFAGQTPADTGSAILHFEPAELPAEATVPPSLANVVRHCLEKEPGRRFQSAGDVAFALTEATSGMQARGAAGLAHAGPRAGRWWLAAMVFAILAAAAILVPRFRSHLVTSSVKRIAVLPFDNLGAAEDEYFADGVADEIRGKLAALSGVEVIARASSMAYKKVSKTPNAIAHELEASYLLSATIRWQKSNTGSRVHITPELVQIQKSGAPTSLWQRRYDAALTDVFSVQSEIATAVARELGLALNASEKGELRERPTANVGAYDAFLKAQEAAGHRPDIRPAIALYDEAVAIDPNFARAWAGLSRACSYMHWYATPSAELADKARHAAQKAVSLAPDHAESHLALAEYDLSVLNDSAGWRAHLGRAVAQGRLNPDALRAKATLEASLAHWDASVDLLTRVTRLDPRSVETWNGLASQLLDLKRYSEARAAVEKGLAISPGNLSLIEEKAESFLLEGDLGKARAVLRSVPREVSPTALVAQVALIDDLAWVLDDEQTDLLLRLSPSAFGENRAQWAICLAQACALRHKEDLTRNFAREAKQEVEGQLRVTPNDPDRHALLGLALAYLGRRDEAVREGLLAISIGANPRSISYLRHQLVRIYILVDEPDKALTELERLLREPYLLSPGRLRIDPNFDPIRNTPRFQRLAASA